MRVLGLIPARGGSKRVPGKNVRLLGGKPLIGWTIEAALKSGVCSELLVSTDDENIAKTANAFQIAMSKESRAKRRLQMLCELRIKSNEVVALGRIVRCDEEV